MAYKMKGHTLPGIKQRETEKNKEKGGKEVERNQWGETPAEYKKRMEDMGLRKPDKKEDSPAKQTKFPNSPGAKKRKQKKFIKKVSKWMKESEKMSDLPTEFVKKRKDFIKKSRDSWQPAFPGADHSKKELKKMTKKQQGDYYN